MLLELKFSKKINFLLISLIIILKIIHEICLYQLFFLSIHIITVVTDSQGKSRGYGFVRFFNEHEQSQAQQQLNGARGLGTKPIRVSKATPKIA